MSLSFPVIIIIIIILPFQGLRSLACFVIVLSLYVLGLHVRACPTDWQSDRIAESLFSPILKVNCVHANSPLFSSFFFKGFV
jgi:hypothetical protein